MATKVKIQVVRTPNIDFPSPESETYKDLEKDIEKAIENKIENGWTYVSSTGGDSFIILMFTKEI